MMTRWKSLQRAASPLRNSRSVSNLRNGPTICTACTSTRSGMERVDVQKKVEDSSAFKASYLPPKRPYSSTATEDSSSTTRKACGKCSTALPLSELSCTSCGALQPLPTSLDAYDLLGINIAGVGANGWKVDLGELKTQWRKRVALSHPDRMGGKDEKEQQIAAQQSALINKAYETLREPLQRAHLLLEKHSSTAPSESDSLEDPEVLMEVMELREGLEDASSEDEAAEVRQKNKVNLDSTIEQLEEAFDADPVDVEKAQKAAIGLRYWTNIDKAAREWQPGKPIELVH